MPSRDRDPFNPPLWPGEPVDVDVEKLLRTQEMKNSFDRRGIFLVYDLHGGDSIRVDVASPEAILEEAAPEQTLSAELWDARSGLFHVTEDTDVSRRYLDAVVNFGTFATRLGQVEFKSGGILRGLITPGQQMVVDARGRHFFDDGAEVQLSPLLYVGLTVNGVNFFNI
jgi:hypothetical protein